MASALMVHAAQSLAGAVHLLNTALALALVTFLVPVVGETREMASALMVHAAPSMAGVVHLLNIALALALVERVVLLVVVDAMLGGCLHHGQLTHPMLLAVKTVLTMTQMLTQLSATCTVPVTTVGTLLTLDIKPLSGFKAITLFHSSVPIITHHSGTNASGSLLEAQLWKHLWQTRVVMMIAMDAARSIQSQVVTSWTWSIGQLLTTLVTALWLLGRSAGS